MIKSPRPFPPLPYTTELKAVVDLKFILTEVREVKLTYHGTIGKRHPRIADSAVCAKLLEHWFNEHMETYEAFRVVLLDHARSCRGVLTIGTGGLCRSVVDQRLIFAAALKSLSSSIIIAHNHPCGTAEPSADDITTTRAIQRTGAFMDIPLVDHLILTRDGYFSFADRGLL